MEKKYKWHKIADLESELCFGDNNIFDINIAGKHVCIIKTSRGIVACTAKCPHAGGDMSQGFLNKNDQIVCPLHRYTFSLLNGRDITNEGYYLKIYPIKENENGIFLGIEESGLLKWLK